MADRKYYCQYILYLQIIFIFYIPKNHMKYCCPSQLWIGTTNCFLFLGRWMESPVDRIIIILLYASWCPFSYEIQSTFGELASRFPNIRHVMAEELIFFRCYNLIIHFASRSVFNLRLDPVVDMTNAQLSHYKETEIFIKEPYLILSLNFIILKAIIYLIPQIKTLWFTHVPHLSAGSESPTSFLGVSSISWISIGLETR
ncbi:hypothetical protein DCAR_0102015 [Daucus carota subsp. sativus]|uniref:Uncharacterized protein n=1 Tax=Daucus carota subsp. sativus TaxID=79200 RepID=A0AAF1AJL6_DAUCS|nr:hypothetical protein DCAR_0102015 [Daucus carota subsp. sativus]